MSRWLVVLAMAGLVAGCGADGVDDAAGPTTAPSSTTAIVTVDYRCSGFDEPVSAVFDNNTDPASMVLTWGQRSANLIQEPSGSGIRYAGGGAVYREHQGEVAIGFDGTVLTCTVA